MQIDSEIVQIAEGRLGTTLKGKWRLKRLLGLGAMAAVYEAAHRNGRLVAIKMLHPALSIHQHLCQRFVREGYAANKVRHDNIAGVYDDDVAEDGSVFLVMELVEGETLGARRRRLGGQLEPDEVLLLMDQLLDALAAAHTRGIVHRDLKPENLLVNRKGQLKVLDFGIARLRELSDSSDATQTGTLLGTPTYMPPEQACGHWDEVDGRSDLFAVGAVMFRLLTARHVHPGSTVHERLAMAITRRAPSIASRRPDLHPSVIELVDGALAFDKEDRWRDARAMQLVLRQAYRDACGQHISQAAAIAVPNLDDEQSWRRPDSASGKVESGDSSVRSPPAVAFTPPEVSSPPPPVEHSEPPAAPETPQTPAELADEDSDDGDQPTVALPHALAKPPDQAPPLGGVAEASAPSLDATGATPSSEISFSEPSAPPQDPPPSKPDGQPFRAAAGEETAPGAAGEETAGEEAAREEAAGEEAAPDAEPRETEPAAWSPPGGSEDTAGPSAEPEQVPSSAAAQDGFWPLPPPSSPQLAPEEASIASAQAPLGPGFADRASADAVASFAPSADASQSLQSLDMVGYSAGELPWQSDAPTAGWPGSRATTAKRRSTALMVASGLAVALVGIAAVTLLKSREADAPPAAFPALEPSSSATDAPSNAASAATSEAPAVAMSEQMVAVAAGSYTLGCDPAQDHSCWDDEKPRHAVAMRAFAIMRHEVTVAEYQRCVAAEACPEPDQRGGCEARGSQPDDAPVTCVDWQAAQAYCTHRGWRLPSEAEWEVAARGAELPDYPWGSEPPSCQKTVLAEGEPGGCGTGGPLPVGLRPADRSWAGALDMGGNVREWTSSDYAAYPGGAAEKGRRGKVNRGGSWSMKPDELNTSHTRGVDRPGEARPDLGFRCAVSL